MSHGRLTRVVGLQVDDSAIVIPRNAVIEANQSGLVAETVIDITPQHPIPRPIHGTPRPLLPQWRVHPDTPKRLQQRRQCH